ncbi:MAG: hypothetical protein ACFWT0_08505 [Bifidobacterium crudilactis]
MTKSLKDEHRIQRTGLPALTSTMRVKLTLPEYIVKQVDLQRLFEGGMSRSLFVEKILNDYLKDAVKSRMASQQYRDAVMAVQMESDENTGLPPLNEFTGI